MNPKKEIILIPDGPVAPPPSKSITHRALLCAALAGGETILENIDLEGEDVAATAACIERLGVTMETDSRGLKISGGLLEKNAANKEEALLLDCGESGSTLRFLIPLLLLLEREAVLTGHGRLMERPNTAYFEALEQNGGKFQREGNQLYLKGSLNPGSYSLPGNISSQFVTGLLLTLPMAKGDSEIILSSELQSKAYVDITMDVMKSFGVKIDQVSDTQYHIPGNQTYRGTTYRIEADFSAAAFFLVAGALGCRTGCLGMNRDSIQGDRAILKIIEECGGEIIEDDELGLCARAGRLSPIVVDVREIPDLAPPIAALLCFAEGQSTITGAARLRIKESDRLHALASQLSSLGADITEGNDFLSIRGVKSLQGGIVDPQQDHRIAMASAVASIKSNGPVTITDPDCVRKSYPGFWEDFCRKERV